jgi:hypothetical protein
MCSPWQLPVPVGDNARHRVVVYFYSDGWIPITYLCLSEAIALYRKALLEGKELLVFPPDLDFDMQNTLMKEPSYRSEFAMKSA